MKIFVINLEKDIKRRDSIKSQMEKFEVPFEFFKGYYAKEMPKNELSKHYDKKKTYRNLCLDLVPAHIGCSLSHAMLYKKIANENIDVACIFEDDVILPSTIKADLEFIASNISKTIPQAILLSPAKTNGNIENSTQNFRIEGFVEGFFTSAYVINNLAAKSLYKNLYPICNVADCWSYIKRHKFVELLATNPGIVEQDQEEFGSSTNADSEVRQVSKIAKTFKYKLDRGFWLTVDFFQALYDRYFNPYGGVKDKKS